MSDHQRLVHFGIGAFHRAHQAYYLQLLNDRLPESKRWFYTDVNLRKETRAVPDALRAQNGQYHFKRIAPNGDAEYIKISSIDRVEDASADPSVIGRIFNDDNVKALTITVTEGGYYLTDSDDINLSHPEVAHDVAVIKQQSGQPKTLYGFLALALLARQKMVKGALTVATCDNLRDNGNRLAKAFGQFAEAAQLSGLKSWMDVNVTFPCSMVDRITPVPPQNLSNEIKQRLGEEDACPILGEDFEQWVIEHKLANAFPALDTVGVTFTKNVHAFEEAKIRILNGGHFMLSYVGALRGYQTFDQNIHDNELNGWLKAYHQKDVIPTIDDRPFDLESYRQIIISRFSNGYIADSIERIAMDSISKFPQFILPTVRLNLERGHFPISAIILIAHWYCFLSLKVRGRIAFNYKDPYLSNAETWMHQKDPVGAFLHDPDIWQGLNKQYPEFGESLKRQIAITMGAYQERYR